MARPGSLSLPRFRACPCGSGLDSAECQAERGYLRACGCGCGRGFHPASNAQRLHAHCSRAQKLANDAERQRRRRPKAKAKAKR